MKKNLLLFMSVLLLTLTAKAQDRVTVSGRKILLNGNLYSIKGICYSPHAIGAPEWIMDFSQIDTDIRMMKDACINTVRTYRPIKDKSVLDAFANAGIKMIIGFTLDETRNGEYINYINTYKNHPAILMWVHGNENNYHPEWFNNNLNNWYSLLNAAAQQTKSIDPNHPVASVHGELPTTQVLNACPNVEIWGMNIYRVDNPGPLYSDWAARSGKPMFIAESGGDSYPDINAPARALTNIWKTVDNNATWKTNNGICSGITFFSWTDEWWKSGDNWNQNTGGFPNSGVPYDGFANEEYWGVLDIYRNPKPAYNALKTAYCSNVGNQPPTVSITSPSNNASFTTGANITISANAADSDGTVSKVEFFRNGVKIGEDLTNPYSFVWSNATAGTYSLTARATDNGGAATTSAAVNVTVSNTTTNTPYGGTPWPIPGRIEAENYDNGGMNVGYYDVTPNNEGGMYRSDAVGIGLAGGTDAGHSVGWTAAGEWLKYTVNVATSGKYDFRLRVASIFTGKKLRVEMNGVNITGSVNVPNTGGWNNWQTVTIPGLNLNAGQQVMRVFMETDGFNLNYVEVSSSSTPNQPPTVSIASPSNNASFTTGANITISANATDSDGTVTKVEFFRNGTKIGEDLTSPYSFVWSNAAAGTYSLTARATDNSGASTTSTAVNVTVSNTTINTPYGGTPWPIPGRIEAENYDNGGMNVGYYDVTPTNEGGAYRTDAVGIGLAGGTDAGYSVGWTAAGEWLKYTVNVSSSGKYDFRLRVASIFSGKKLRVEMNGVNVTGSVNVPNTGGWSNWQTVTIPGLNLNAGQQVMRVFMETDGFNLNYIDVSSSSSPNQPPTVSITSPSNNAPFTAGANITISANATDSDGTVSKVEFFRNGVKIGEDLTSPYSITWSNVAEGSYVLTARATDNAGASTTSSGINISVTSSQTTTCSGGVSNGDYTYEVFSTNSTSTIKFIPGTPILGTTMVIMYYKVGSGALMGVHMDPASGGTYTKAFNAPVGSEVTFYFTYRIGTSGAERNSSATPHNFTAGSCGSGARAALYEEDAFNVERDIEIYPNPAKSSFDIKLTSLFDQQCNVVITDIIGNTVYSTTVSSGDKFVHISSEGFNNGIYFVSVQSGKEVIVKKVMIAK